MLRADKKGVNYMLYDDLAREYEAMRGKFEELRDSL